MEEEHKGPGSSRGKFQPLMDRWGYTVQTITGIAIVVVAVLTFVIQQGMEEERIEREKAQEEEKIASEKSQAERDAKYRREEARRAAIDRSIALYDYFMNSEHTRQLMETHVEVNKKRSAYESVNTTQKKSFSDREVELSRHAGVKAIIEATKGDRRDQTYKFLALLLNDVPQIYKCGAFGEDDWNRDGTFSLDKDELRDTSPLCDRETFHTLLLGPLSEIYFSFRFFFYCEQVLGSPYWEIIKYFEVMVAEYTYRDFLARGEKRHIFREYANKEAAQDDDLITGSTQTFMMRLPKSDSACVEFREAFQS